jgi:hypothetical protein
MWVKAVVIVERYFIIVDNAPKCPETVMPSVIVVNVTVAKIAIYIDPIKDIFASFLYFPCEAIRLRISIA